MLRFELICSTLSKSKNEKNTIKFGLRFLTSTPTLKEKKTFPEVPPEKPPPPITCCMQGCVHCVWFQYIIAFKEYLNQKKKWHSSRWDWVQHQKKQNSPMTPDEQALFHEYENEDLKWKALNPEDPEYQQEALNEMDPLLREFWEMEQVKNQSKRT